MKVGCLHPLPAGNFHPLQRAAFTHSSTSIAAILHPQYFVYCSNFTSIIFHPM
jgi:hypothetical protein